MAKALRYTMKLTLLLALLSVVVVAGLASPQDPVLRSGIDLITLDSSVRAQDDLFRYVNGAWLARTDIPPDMVTYSAFIELVEKTERDIRAIIEDLIATPDRPPGSPAQQITDLYGSMMNEGRVEELGIGPVRGELQKIEAITTTQELAAEAGYLSAIAAGGPFGGSVDLDAQDPRALVVTVTQGGTLLPERDDYSKENVKFVAIRKSYEEYLTRVFTLTGRTNPASDARDVLALETELAKVQWTLADSRDPAKTYNKFRLAELATEMPGFDWLAWAKPQGIDRARYVVLAQPSFFKSFAALVPVTPLRTWKAWLVARYITASSPFLTKALADARFDFFGRTLTGQQLPRPRWKRGVSLVSGYLGDAIGRLYVEKHFPPLAKTRMQALIANVIAAFRKAIIDLDWMTPATKLEALDKLSMMATKIGHPDKWRDYGELSIKADDLLGNIQRAQRFENDQRMARLSKPLGRGDWLITAQTPNAYYSPARNEIILPAAILQPPFFDVSADEAVNYGGIGAIIGHELGHAFDDRGRYSDGAGAARDWWTSDDERGFRTRAQMLIGQVDAYSRHDGMAVSGELTLRENLGDLGGLSIAYRAYKQSLAGRPSPVIDGFTGEQRFFLGWARVWRAKVRPEYVRQHLLSSPHAPAHYRANLPLTNVSGFYEAFLLKPGDKLYREPETRIRIW